MTDYNIEITKALKKYAKNFNKSDLEDIRQDIALSIFTYKGDMTKKLAYDIAKKRTIDFVRKVPPRSEDISDKEVVDKVDSQLSRSGLSVDVKLDIDKAIIFLHRLKEPYKSVLIYSFGIDDSELTDKQIGELYGYGGSWVGKVREIALQRLRNLMEKK